MCTPGKLQQRQRVTAAAWWTACPCSLCLPNCVHLQANNLGHHLTQSLLPALRLFAKSNARLGMILDKIVLSVPGSGTAHGGWAHAWPSHKLLRQVQMPAAGQLHIQSRQMGLSVFIRSFGIHIKVHKLSSTRRPRTIHTWHVTVGRLRCRLQACREFHGGGTQQCWLLHSCALVMTVATSGRVSALRGGWQPSIYSGSS